MTQVRWVPDSAGFISQQCKQCQRYFKYQPTDDIRSPQRCAYCGAEGGNLLTGPQQDYFTALLAKQAQDMIYGTSSGSRPTLPTAVEPVEADDDLPQVAKFSCCDATIRHDGASTSLHCIRCGELVTVGG